MGGGAPAGSLVWVPYPQGLEKGVVVGTVKGGGGRHRGHTVQRGKTIVLCHRGDNHGAVAKGVGAGAKQQSKPPPTQVDEAASHTPTPKPTEAAVKPAIGFAPAELRLRQPPPGRPRTTPRTPKLFGSPHRPANAKGHRGPLWVSLEDIHVTMGLQRVKGCCVLCVCVCVCLRQWEGCLILKIQTSKRVQKTCLKQVSWFLNAFYKD